MEGKMAEETKRTTVTLPAKHLAFYANAVKERRREGKRATVADLIREAIAADVKRREEEALQEHAE